MKCPACNNMMEEVKVEEITVDVCKGGCEEFGLTNLNLKKLMSLTSLWVKAFWILRNQIALKWTITNQEPAPDVMAPL